MFTLKPGQIRANATNVIYLDPAVIYTSPFQARQTYSDLDQLADSLLAEGQLIPIRVWFTPTGVENGATVTDGNRTYIPYCHDGNRRLRAFKLALEKEPNSTLLSRGIKTIVIPEIPDEIEAIISQYSFNNTGRSFNALEEAEICSKLVKAGFSQTEVGKKLGKSQQWVKNTISLLSYSEEVKQLIRDDQLSASLATALLKDTEDKAELENSILDTAKTHGKVTKSKLTGKDGRKKENKKKAKPKPINPDHDLDELSFSQITKLLLDTSHSLKAINDTEFSVTVSKTLWWRLENLLDPY